jgi:hypothetical protein
VCSRSIGEIETAFVEKTAYRKFFPFARNRHSRQSFAARNHRVNKSGVASPASPFIRRAEPQHEKLRLKDGAAYHLPPQVRTESARRRVAGALALRAARADRPEKPYRVEWWPDAAPGLAGARRERPAGAPTRHARRRRASEGHDVDRPLRSAPRRARGCRLRRVARASMRASSPFRVFALRCFIRGLRRRASPPSLTSVPDLLAGTRTRPGRTRCASSASPAAL